MIACISLKGTERTTSLFSYDPNMNLIWLIRITMENEKRHFGQNPHFTRTKKDKTVGIHRMWCKRLNNMESGIYHRNLQSYIKASVMISIFKIKTLKLFYQDLFLSCHIIPVQFLLSNTKTSCYILSAKWRIKHSQTHSAPIKHSSWIMLLMSNHHIHTPPWRSPIPSYR